jgi:hypothetical protein
MLLKARLHDDVHWHLRHNCSQHEVESFVRQLNLVRQRPLENSEPIDDPELSRYKLRFFRFGNNIAVFQYDMTADRIYVLKCRRVRPQRKRRRESDPAEPP